MFEQNTVYLPWRMPIHYNTHVSPPVLYDAVHLRQVDELDAEIVFSNCLFGDERFQITEAISQLWQLVIHIPFIYHLIGRR